MTSFFFVLFVYDIRASFRNVRYLIFADDLKIFLLVNSIYDCAAIKDNLKLLKNGTEQTS